MLNCRDDRVSAESRNLSCRLALYSEVQVYVNYYAQIIKEGLLH